jgi:hypothetical protein
VFRPTPSIHSTTCYNVTATEGGDGVYRNHKHLRDTLLQYTLSRLDTAVRSLPCSTLKYALIVT